MMTPVTRPLLLLDVDGVLNPFGAASCPRDSTEHHVFPDEEPVSAPPDRTFPERDPDRRPVGVEHGASPEPHDRQTGLHHNGSQKEAPRRPEGVEQGGDRSDHEDGRERDGPTARSSAGTRRTACR